MCGPRIKRAQLRLEIFVGSGAVDMRDICSSEEVEFLKRRIRRVGKGLEVVGDGSGKLWKVMLHEWGCLDSKPACNPGLKAEGEQDERELVGEEFHLFRRTASQLLYYSLDRPDLQFSVK